VSEIDHPAQAPPSGEELHLPGPSLLPFLCAIAITLVVVGTTISLIVSIVGVVALVIIVIRWVADTRRDVAELPESHH
jgi:Flp pilus assembly protein TadB